MVNCIEGETEKPKHAAKFTQCKHKTNKTIGKVANKSSLPPTGNGETQRHPIGAGGNDEYDEHFAELPRRCDGTVYQHSKYSTKIQTDSGYSDDEITLANKNSVVGNQDKELREFEENGNQHRRGSYASNDDTFRVMDWPSTLPENHAKTTHESLPQDHSIGVLITDKMRVSFRSEGEGDDSPLQNSEINIILENSDSSSLSGNECVAQKGDQLFHPTKQVEKYSNKKTRKHQDADVNCPVKIGELGSSDDSMRAQSWKREDSIGKEEYTKQPSSDHAQAAYRVQVNEGGFKIDLRRAVIERDRIIGHIGDPLQAKNSDVNFEALRTPTGSKLVSQVKEERRRADDMGTRFSRLLAESTEKDRQREQIDIQNFQFEQLLRKAVNMETVKNSKMEAENITLREQIEKLEKLQHGQKMTDSHKEMRLTWRINELEDEVKSVKAELENQRYLNGVAVDQVKKYRSQASELQMQLMNNRSSLFAEIMESIVSPRMPLGDSLSIPFLENLEKQFSREDILDSYDAMRPPNVAITGESGLKESGVVGGYESDTCYSNRAKYSVGEHESRTYCNYNDTLSLTVPGQNHGGPASRDMKANRIVTDTGDVVEVSPDILRDMLGGSSERMCSFHTDQISKWVGAENNGENEVCAEDLDTYLNSEPAPEIRSEMLPVPEGSGLAITETGNYPLRHRQLRSQNPQHEAASQTVDYEPSAHSAGLDVLAKHNSQTRKIVHAAIRSVKHILASQKGLIPDA